MPWRNYNGIHAMQLPTRLAKYTYRDYLSWDDKRRWELIDGVAYSMSPAPSIKHQQIIGRFYARLEFILRGHRCLPFISPTDVVLSEHNVVQPDIFVVCDSTKIGEPNIQGAPDIVIEVLSPATERKDRLEKKLMYEKFGVKEYILINPDAQYAERFLLEKDGTFGKSQVLGCEQILVFKALPKVEIPLWEVFGMEKPEMP